MSTYDCVMIFSVSIKYWHSTEKGQMTSTGDRCFENICMKGHEIVKTVTILR
jgi:hypothetical protein